MLHSLNQVLAACDLSYRITHSVIQIFNLKEIDGVIK